MLQFLLNTPINKARRKRRTEGRFLEKEREREGVIRPTLNNTAHKPALLYRSDNVVKLIISLPDVVLSRGNWHVVSKHGEIFTAQQVPTSAV